MDKNRKRIIHHNVDIYRHPAKDNTVLTQVTIGDLHGNAIKLLYMLVRHGVCEISNKEYNNLVTIYREIADLTAHDLSAAAVLARARKSIRCFNKTIERHLTVINPTILVRLIGDELADRGSNDWFVLKLYQKLHKAKVKVSTLVSNHGGEFVRACETLTKRKKLESEFIKKDTAGNDQAISLTLLNALAERDVITYDEILDVSRTCYLPTVKLLDYSIGKDNHITLISHAPIDMTIIKSMALKFEIEYKDNTTKALANTIDQINQEFACCIKNGLFNLIFDSTKIHDNGNRIDKKYPVEFAMWNRNYTVLDRAKDHNGYQVTYVHGHDSHGPTVAHVENLDNQLGKGASNVGTYEVFVSDEPYPARQATNAGVLNDLFDKKWFILSISKRCTAKIVETLREKERDEAIRLQTEIINKLGLGLDPQDSSIKVLNAACEEASDRVGRWLEFEVDVVPAISDAFQQYEKKPNAINYDALKQVVQSHKGDLDLMVGGFAALEKKTRKPTPTQPKRTLDDIKRAVYLAQQNYAGWYEGNNDLHGQSGFFSWLRHGQYGQRRALDLVDLIDTKKTIKSANNAIQAWLSDRHTRYHRHSFSSFLLEELGQLDILPWREIKPDDEDEYKYTKNNVITHLGHHP